MRCPECGGEGLVPSEHRIRIDRGEEFGIPLPAVECPDCGKMFAAEGARERIEQMHSARTDPPPASGTIDKGPGYVAWATRRRTR